MGTERVRTAPALMATEHPTQTLINLSAHLPQSSGRVQGPDPSVVRLEPHGVQAPSPTALYDPLVHKVHVVAPLPPKPAAHTARQRDLSNCLSQDGSCHDGLPILD